VDNSIKDEKDEKTRNRRTLSGWSGDGGWLDQQEGAMAFPSAEGALLSISFLTFPVFLIKLVLVSSNLKFIDMPITVFQQVIQAIKMKKYAWSQMNGAETMQTSNVIIKRHRNTRKFSISDPDDVAHLSRVLRSIETLKI
jgi:hypothetical protein